MTTQMILNTVAAVAAIALVCLVIYLAYAWYKTKKTTPTTATPTATPDPATENASNEWDVVDRDEARKFKKFFLKKGSKELHIATYYYETDKLCFIKNDPTGTGYNQTEVEKPVIQVWVDEDTRLGKITVSNGEAHFQPNKKAEN